VTPIGSLHIFNLLPPPLPQISCHRPFIIIKIIRKNKKIKMKNKIKICLSYSENRKYINP